MKINEHLNAPVKPQFVVPQETDKKYSNVYFKEATNTDNSFNKGKYRLQLLKNNFSEELIVVIDNTPEVEVAIESLPEVLTLTRLTFKNP